MRLVYSNLKDKLPNGLKSDVVYLIKCKNCVNKHYIGQTGQLMKNRISGHRSTVTTKQDFRTALAKHAIERNHEFDFECENVEFLDSHRDKNKREFLEEIYIKCSPHCVNLRSVEACNISPIYTEILKLKSPWNNT